MVLDHVGGSTFAACLPATRVDGAVVNIGRLGTAESTTDLDALSCRHLRVAGMSLGFTGPAELGAVIAADGAHPFPGGFGDLDARVVRHKKTLPPVEEVSEGARSPCLPGDRRPFWTSATSGKRTARGRSRIGCGPGRGCVAAVSA
ncbi:hypothetical protein [Streptomyces sp. RKAG337]|uniref:hypothetical protein n=1 Tax=Streptomyces sp. RKAG337 TaxID=2893404 RepID=UPI0020331DFB|nr:hypothetical protein [Streptomyces sp. RKAG337]MCM2424925.1 hypothetical protein [Streptomyces sp. RKAG337]